MRRLTHRRRGALTMALCTLLLLLGAFPASAAPKTLPTPIEGLNGALGLSVGADGSVYVADTFGGTLARYDRQGRRVELAQGDISGVDATGRGQVWFTDATPPEAGGDGNAYLLRVAPNGTILRTVNLTEYEAANNPDQVNRYGFMGADACVAGIADPAVREALSMFVNYEGIVESNPYAVAIESGGVLVADAAGNSILRVTGNGKRVSTVAVLPPQPAVTVDSDLRDAIGGILGEILERPEPVTLPDCLLGTSFVGESVPTDIEIGPDGHYYVSTLPGLPELPGSASVYRIDSRTHEVERVATGFSGAVDLAVAGDGTIYVAELFGSQVSLVRGGNVVATIPLPLPGAVEVGPDGRVLVAIGTFFGPGGASVISITP